jgi:nitroreductase
MLDAIRKRRSIRKYKKKPVEQEKLDEILRAAMFSPSAMHRRPWEFIIVRDQDMKNSLARATPWCSFVKEAPVVVIITAAATESWWIEDCSIAAEAIYLEAENQGLGTCFCQILNTTGPEKNGEEYVRQLIGAPKDLRVLCMMPLGYPGEEKPEHDEKEFDKKKIHLDKY